MATASTLPSDRAPGSREVLPESIHVADFTLSVGGERAEEIATLFRTRLQQEFSRLQPLLVGLLYELEIEEGKVWTGSRKSRNRAKLKRRKTKTKGPGGRLKGFLFAIMFGLKIISMDYGQIEENFDSAREYVEKTFEAEGHDVQVEELQIRAVPDPEPQFRGHYT